MITQGFIVLACGHWQYAAVSSRSTHQLGAQVQCDRCGGEWYQIRVVTG